MLMEDMMINRRKVAFSLITTFFLFHFGCKREGVRSVCEIPILPDKNKIIVEENPPGLEDMVRGVTGAIGGRWKVILFGDWDMKEEIGSVIAEEDGSFIPMSIGDNKYGIVYLITEDEGGNRTHPIPLLNDIVPPDTILNHQIPDFPEYGTGRIFTFTSTEEARFECQEHLEWFPCSSPYKQNFYEYGYRTFSVRAIDRAGNIDESPARYKWYSFDPFDLLWERDIGTIVFFPVVEDIDEDGKVEVVFATGTGEGRVYALNGEDGSFLWVSEVTGVIIGDMPSIGDVNGDGKVEVVAGFWGGIYAFNGKDGSVLKKYSYGENKWALSPALGDVDGDGKLDIIAATPAWKEEVAEIYAFDGESGDIKWVYPFPSTISFSDASVPSLGDVDGDGMLEVIMNADCPDYKRGGLYVLEGESGSLKWAFTDIRFYISPVLADVDGDAKPEIIAYGYDGVIYVFNGEDGSLLWYYSTDCYYQYPGQPIVIDVEGDGSLEVVVPSSSDVYILNGKNGKVRCKYEEENIPDKIFTPFAGDMNGDGYVDIIITTRESTSIFSGENCSLLYEYLLKGDNFLSIWDVNGDGKVNFIIGYGSFGWDGREEYGGIYAVSLPNSSFPPPELLPWPKFRHDVKNTGLYTGDPYPPW